MTADADVLGYFKRCASLCRDKTACAKLFLGEILPAVIEKFSSDYISPKNFAEIVAMSADGTLVSTNAKKLVHLCASENTSPAEIARREKLLKITDEAVLAIYADEAISQNQRSVADYIKGKKSASKQILGAVMRASGGAADPIISARIIEEMLEKLKPGADGDFV